MAIDFVNTTITTPSILPKFDAMGWDYEPINHRGPKPKRLKAHTWSFRGMTVSNYVQHDTWYLKGSLHYFANYGKHNCDDFTYERLCYTIAEIADILKLCPYSIDIHGIEFGVNFSYHGSKFTKGLMYHEGLPFRTQNDTDGRAYECRHLDYRLKGYDKAAQNKIAYALGLSRWEVHVRKMRWINKTGITTLGDLLDIDNLMMLKAPLIKSLDEVTYYDDTIRPKELSQRDRFKLRDYRNRDYWNELTRSCRGKAKKRLQGIIENHSDHKKENLLEIISDKWCDLIETRMPIQQILLVLFGYVFTI